MFNSSKNGTGWRDYYVTTDTYGSVCQLIRADTGTVVARYNYDSFGVVTKRNGIAAPADQLDTDQVNQQYRFQSHWRDTTSGLSDFGFRFYSPGTGRFINQDPIEESGGINLYGFVGGNPTNDFDLFGLQQGQGGRGVVNKKIPPCEDNGLPEPFADAMGFGITHGLPAAVDGANPFGDPFADKGYYNKNEGWAPYSQGFGAIAGAAGTAAGGLAIGGSLGLGTTGVGLYRGIGAAAGTRVIIGRFGAAATAGAAGGILQGLSKKESGGQIFRRAVNGTIVGGATRNPFAGAAASNTDTILEFIRRGF